jgi:hypothetical protein
MSAGDTSARRARDLVLGFERSCDPFRHLARSASIWTALRFGVAERLRIALGGMSGRHAAAPATRATLSALRSMARERRDFNAIVRSRKRYRFLALTTNNRLRDRIGDRYRNVYYDYFDPELPDALHLYLDSPDSRRAYYPASAHVSARALWPEMTRMRLSGVDGKAALDRLAYALGDYLKGEGHAAVVPGLVSGWERELRVFVARFDSFQRLYDAIQPEVVISDCYYDRTWAVAAARSHGIPVWELQHGVVYDGHMAYTFDPSSAELHRHTMPVPDRLLTFGRYFSDVFLERGFWRPDQVTELGLARLYERAQGFEWAPPDPGKAPRVLVSSQWILTGRWSELLRAVTARVPEVRIVVKPHPLEAPDAYTGIPGVDVLDRGGDFYDALRGCHVHCSAFSTTLLESVGLGVPTLIVGLPGSEAVSPFAEAGACRMEEDADALAALLSRLDGAELADWHRQTLQSRERFWAPDPGAAMRRLLDELP